MSLAEKQRRLIEDLNLIHDPHEKLSVVTARGAGHQLPLELRNEEHLVRGCVSRVWLTGSLHDGRCHFECDAESPMVKGLIALLCEIYSDSSPAEVVSIEPEVWTACGFDRLLSPTRQNGLAAARLRIRELARELASTA